MLKINMLSSKTHIMLAIFRPVAPTRNTAADPALTGERKIMADNVLYTFGLTVIPRWPISPLMRSEWM